MIPLRVILLLVLLAALPAAPAMAQAGWLDRLARIGEHLPTRSIRSAASLEQVAAAVARLPERLEGGGVALAAQVTQEGHWTLVNRTGERFIAAGTDELRRGLTLLAPETATPGAKAVLHVTEDTLFRLRERIAELPRGSEVVLATMAGASPVRITSSGVQVAARPGLWVSAADQVTYGEVQHYLTRPLNRANVRLLALEPGGPKSLSATPRIEAGNGRALVDSVDPAALPATMSRIRAQTAVLVGRVDGDVLIARGPRGGDARLPLATVRDAAAAYDVDLIILHSASGTQPGGRNWLWMKTEVKGLDDALRRATMADFLAALRRGASELIVSADTTGPSTAIEIISRPAPGASTVARVGGRIGELTLEVAGQLTVEGARITAPARERHEELDRRIFKAVPSLVTNLWLGGLVLGLMAFRVALGWWQRLWPAETRAEYRNALGYHAARTVRLAVFLLGFLPLLGIPAFIMASALRVRDVLAWLGARMRSAFSRAAPTAT
jgi:hypothetical protein